MSNAAATSWGGSAESAGVTAARIWAPILARLAPPLCVVLSAGLYTLAFAPYEWSGAAWAAPGVLLAGTRRLRPRWALLAGVVYGLLLGVGVTPWVAHATLAYFNFNRLLAAAFALAVYVVYGGIPYASLTWAYALTANRLGPTARALLAGCLWASSELLRANMFTGLPWTLLGHSQFRNLWVIQVADLGGVYAVSCVMAVVSVAVAELVVAWAGAAPPRRQLARRLWLPAASLLAVGFYGVHAQTMPQTPGAPSSSRRVAVVQGNVANAFRWKREHVEHVLATYVALSTRLGADHPDLIVWPENAVSFYIDREPRLRQPLGQVAALAHDGLLVGAPRLGTADTAHNSAYLVGAGGRVVATYDKRRLVPFAEYSPFPWFRETPAAGMVTYAPGVAADPVRSGDLRVGTVICYEVLFPHLVRDLVRNGAELLVNLSNDSWLDRGDGVAPRQHFSMSVFRAVETRRYLVRASASGVSGFISPTGHIYSELASDTAGSAVAPVQLRQGKTAYVRWGDAWVMLATGLALGAVIVRRRLA